MDSRSLIRSRRWSKRLSSLRRVVSDRVVGSSDWGRRFAFIAVLAALLLLFERLAPAIALLSGAYIIVSRLNQLRPAVARRPERRETEPALMPEAAPAPAAADVIPISSAFAPAWKDIDDFLQASLDIIKNRFEFQTANVFLRGADRHVLVQKAYVSATRSIARLATIRVGHGLVGWVAQNKRPLVVNNLHHEGRSLGYYRAAGEQIGSFAAAPILVDEELLGVISLDHSEPDAFPSPETEEALMVLGGLLARALGAEETMQERMREADRLREARRILRAAYEAEDLDGAAEATLKELVTLAEFHSLACYLLDETGSPSRRAAIGFHGISGQMVKEPVMQRAVTQALSQLTPYRVEGVALAAQYRSGRQAGLPALPELLVALPVLHRGQPLGALVVELQEKKTLDDRLEGILEDVVNDLGGAFLRTYRAAQAEGAARNESEMVKFSTELIEVEGTEEVWEKLFAHLLSNTRATAAAAFRCEERRFVVESVAGCTPVSDEVPKEEGLLGWTVLARRPVVAARQDRRRVPIEEGESFLVFPIGEPDSPRSVVVLSSTEKEAFTEEDMDRAREIAETVRPILSVMDRLEEARTKLEQDSLTGLLNTAGFEKRLGVLALGSEVSTALFRIEGYERLQAEYGRREAESYLRRCATLFENVAGRRGILARLEGPRFCLAVRGDADALRDELLEVSATSSLASVQEIPLRFRAVSVSTAEGVRWEEHIAACEGRLAAMTRPARAASSSAGGAA